MTEEIVRDISIRVESAIEEDLMDDTEDLIAVVHSHVIADLTRCMASMSISTLQIPELYWWNTVGPQFTDVVISISPKTVKWRFHFLWMVAFSEFNVDLATTPGQLLMNCEQHTD